MRLRRPIAAAFIAAASVAAITTAPTTTAASTRYPVGNSISGYVTLLISPSKLPAGMNIWTCKPTAAHPRPVVLLPGTLWTLTDSFAALSPILANDGYCVFGLNYGASPLTTQSGGRVYAAGDIPTSARQLKAFVDQVLAATHTTKLDIVGWSQGGGVMPRYYINRLGGANKVNALIALAGSNHGTTIDGLHALIAGTLIPGLQPFTLLGCPACTQQMKEAPFTIDMNSGPDTVPGVRYTVIESTRDEIVTPYTSSFLVGAHNITLQTQCPLDLVDHLAMPYDSAAIQDIRNALGPDDPNFRPRCGLTLPLIGG